MGAVRGAERVVDVHVAQGGQFLRKLRVVFLLFRVIAEVFEQQNFAGFGQHGLDLGADAIGSHPDGLAQQFREPDGCRSQAHFRIRFALRPSQVAGENQSCAVIERVLNAGQGSLNTFIAGNFFSAGCERDVKIHPHEDSLSFKREIANR